jgi:hypothetical protein
LKKRVLCAAGPTAFLQNRERAVDDRVPSVGQATHKSGCGSVVKRAELNKSVRDFTTRLEHNWFEHIP